MTAVLPWVRRAVDLVYPRNCRACATPLAEDEPGVICPACLAGAKRIAAPCCRRCALPFAGKLDELIECGYCKDLQFHFSRAVAACRAEGIVRDCIHRFKYNREMYYEGHLAGWLVAGAREWLSPDAVDVVVPVPLHPLKERAREFNQAERLARHLGRALAKPVIANCVRRVKVTATQTRLDAHARRDNLRQAFAAGRGRITGLRVLLVDDVFTTGATLDSCASLLHNEGAIDVIAITVARGV
jgi:ComF family protein